MKHGAKLCKSFLYELFKGRNDSLKIDNSSKDDAKHNLILQTLHLDNTSRAGGGAGKAPYPQACVCLGSDPPCWDVHRDMADDGLLKI